MSVKVAAAGPIARSVASLAGKIRDQVWRQRLAKNFPYVFQRHAPAIMEIPVRACEAGPLGAQIQLRVQGFYNQFVQVKRIAVQYEFRREIEAQGYVVLEIQFHLVPAEVSSIGRIAIGRHHVLQYECETLPLQ